MSEDTLEALSSITFCPICGAKGVNFGLGYLQRNDDCDDSFRKTRVLYGKCPKCAEEGRGEVYIMVHQRF